MVLTSGLGPLPSTYHPSTILSTNHGSTTPPLLNQSTEPPTYFLLIGVPGSPPGPRANRSDGGVGLDFSPLSLGPSLGSNVTTGQNPSGNTKDSELTAYTVSPQKGRKDHKSTRTLRTVRCPPGTFGQREEVKDGELRGGEGRLLRSGMANLVRQGRVYGVMEIFFRV